MRICFVTPEFVTEEASYDGGLANYLHRIALSLKKGGHDAVVVVASDRDERLVKDDIDVRRVSVALHDATYRKILRYFPGLDWHLMSWQLNVAVRQLHNEKAIDVVQYASVGATALHRVKQIPSIVRVSGNQKLWDDAYEQPVTKTAQKYQRLEIEALRKADSVFGPSHIVANYLHEEHKVPVKVIESPYVQDVADFSYETHDKIRGELGGREYFLFFGSLGLAKGVKEIAEALPALLDKYRHMGMVFIGKDLGMNGKPIFEYVKECGGAYSDRIIWHDRIRHQALYPLIRNAKLVLLPSRIDNFPNCCLEAMAFGKVVIGTRGTSFEQLINSGVNGFLCNPMDPRDLFDTIVQAMDLDESTLAGMGSKAAARIALLSPEAITEKLLILYADVMGERQCHR